MVEAVMTQDDVILTKEDLFGGIMKELTMHVLSPPQEGERAYRSGIEVRRPNGSDSGHVRNAVGDQTVKILPIPRGQNTYVRTSRYIGLMYVKSSNVMSIEGLNGVRGDSIALHEVEGHIEVVIGEIDKGEGEIQVPFREERLIIILNTILIVRVVKTMMESIEH